MGGTGLQTQPAQQPAQQNAIQQHLIHLSTSPYGDNPLFKVTDPSKRTDNLKPINPAAQKAILMEKENNVYKLSPHRNIKAKVTPNNKSAGLLLNTSASLNKSAIFDGLDEDNSASVSASELFVPRSSVKKLVIKSKKTSLDSSLNLNSVNNTTENDNEKNESRVSFDESSLNLPSVKKNSASVSAQVEDESFAVLNPNRHKPQQQLDESVDILPKVINCLLVYLKLFVYYYLFVAGT